MVQIIGIDIGDVAVQKGTEYENDTGQYMVEFMDDFLESIKILSESNNILYFISYCGNRREKQIRDFFQRTKKILDYIPEERWIFVRDKMDKAPICIQHKITVMIDDNIEICTDVFKRSPTTRHVILFTEKTVNIKNIKRLCEWKSVVNYIINL